ncbi:MAG: type II secretion system minor pseudopilin GspI [Burkholderiales bacterium]|nr:type II secretion system minor pseudopilin GspI [Burkholderiales bacterium]
MKRLESRFVPGAQVAKKRTLNGASTTHFKPQRHLQGFTLIEVLVALFILSISVLAGLRAAAGMTLNAERQWQMLLAQTCVDNALVQLRLSPQFANLGEQDLPCPQAGLALRLRLMVAVTPNPSFRRVDVQVMNKETPLLRVTALQGRY